MSIVGTGLRYVEQVSMRVTNGTAALSGAGQGAAFGLLWAALLGLFITDSGAFVDVLVFGLSAGAIFGAIFGWGFHYMLRGRRDFDSTVRTRADRYEVQVDEEFANRAGELLASMPMAA